MLDDVKKAKIVVTNFHAFKLREKVQLAAGTRALVEGRRGEKMKTLESDGDMIQRVMGELASMKNIVVINDEAHHCYREKPKDEDHGLTS